MVDGNFILQARGLIKTYVNGEIETPALRGVDLELAAGEFVSVVGPSGCGKTTLLNLVGGLDRPTSGEITLDDVRLDLAGERELSKVRLHNIGFVFQAYNLFPVLSAAENVEYVLMLRGIPAAERRRKALELLETVGLSEMADRRPTRLSGGQQQRVAVARAISTNPRLVLADEPTANLDSESAGQLLDMMEALNRERGVTFLFSTHDPRVVERARRVVRLRDGLVVDGESGEDEQH
ncbi:MAG: ABC transporter ATP-binding protein [Candidatus Glassbacteria bacterium]|nr:ABC transporter ATP-binding protein [Candidatus Glassbacteria bacterium]